MGEALTCSITCSIIAEPVTSKYGHNYEKGAIEEWID